MASHYEFIVSGRRFRLTATCHMALWPMLVRRVNKLFPADAKSFEKVEETVILHLKTNINKTDINFTITVNPDGIPIHANY